MSLRRIAGLLANLIVIVAILHPNAGAQIFPNPPIYSTGPQPNQIVVADFDNDGNLDVAVLTLGVISVLRGTADGTFHPRVDYALAGDLGTSIAVGDFNGDGYPDLVVTSLSVTPCTPRGYVSILINKGNGTFLPRVDYTPVGCFPNGVVVGDFNHDGKLDVANLDETSANGEPPGSVDVFLGNGDGTLRPPVNYVIGPYPWKIVAGDFNGDKNLDLAVCYLSALVGVLLGNGDGTFQPHMDFGNPTSGDVGSIVAADFNGDGKLDLADGDGDVHVFLGKGDGSFQPQIDVQDFGLFRYLAVGDVNGDGVLDLVGNGISILLGNGDGSFQPGYLYDWSGFPTTLVDLNHDGKLDVLSIANNPFDGANGDGVLGVFFGNGDGTFQNADRSFPFPLVGQTSDSTDVVADFNGDGILDIASTNAIMLGNGDGTFQPYSYFLTGNVDFVDVTTADFNGDGKPDLAVTTLDFNNRIYAVNVLLGKGDGTFRPPVAYNLSDAGSVTAADLNGDHIPDLVVDNPDGFVEVLLGRGDGTFQSPGEYPTLFSAGTLLVGDFNGDGKPDILATGCSPGCATGAYIFLRGNGDGTFQPGTEVDLPANQLALAAGDFDGDGRLDFAVTLFTNQVTIFLGNGDGTFEQSQSYDLGGRGFPIRVADFNGDGKLDLAITTDQLALLLGNGDGTFQPVQYYVAGCCRSGIGDFNADGKPDLDVGGNILLNIADIPSFTFSINLTGTGTGAVTVVPGFVCTNSCSHDYAKGGNLTLTAKANTGSTFSGWTGGGCSGTGACNITITTNVSVTATFDLTPDFSISASALSPGTVSPGGSATSNIDVTAVGGFNSSVALTCSVSPSPQLAPTCSISPNSVNPGTAATLTVTTFGSNAQLGSSRGLVLYAVWLPLLGMVTIRKWRGSTGPQKVLLGILFSICITASLISLAACGGGGSNSSGGGNSGTPAGNYTITIKGTSGSTQHTASITLTVQ